MVRGLGVVRGPPCRVHERCVRISPMMSDKRPLVYGVVAGRALPAMFSRVDSNIFL